MHDAGRPLKLWSDDLEGLRKEALDLFLSLPAPQPTDSRLSAADRVAVMRANMAAMAMPTSDMAEQRSIPGPHGDIPLRVFVPAAAPKAVYIEIHGGGWVVGTAEGGDLQNEHLSNTHDMVVVSVDYRLAPDAPHPIPADECQAAIEWVLETGPTEWGTDRILIGGASAGAHLALVALLRARDRLGVIDRFVGANLVFGPYDLRGTPSHFDDSYNDGLSGETIQFLIECLTPGLSDADRRDPDISPLFADLSGLPHALITVGAIDSLRDDSYFLATRWANAGSECELAVYPDSPHGFTAMPTRIAAAARGRIDDWFRVRLG